MPPVTAPERGHDVYQAALAGPTPPEQPHKILGCPQCREAMAHLRLPGHMGRQVDLDHCRPCGLVWFDAMESVHLSGLGWVQTLRELQIGATPDRPVVDRLSCPLCRSVLRPVRNATRFGRFPSLECPTCAGHLHSQAGMLAERGLVRPLLAAERGALKAERRLLCCLNCGAPSDGEGDTCRYCTTPLLMIDLPRLQHALRLRPETLDQSAPADGRPLAWACRACGAALDPGRDVCCGQCRHPVVVPSLIDLAPLLAQLENEWREDLARQRMARDSRRASYRADGAMPRVKERRQRTWRDTAVGRLLHHMGTDDDSRWEWTGPPVQVLSWVVLLVVLIVMVKWVSVHYGS